MSRHQRTLKKIFETPTRADIRWEAIEGLVRNLGGDVVQRSGSRVALQLEGRVAVCHKPHPGPEAKKSTVEDVREFLEKAGFTP